MMPVKLKPTTPRFCSFRIEGFQSWINKILVRIANREDPDQTASSEAV